MSNSDFSMLTFQNPPSNPELIVRRLSIRLQHLYQTALNSGPFDEIWDLCCDHGRLGLHLSRTLSQLQEVPSTCVHLVDCVPSIIDPLQNQYAEWIGEHLRITCMDAGDIQLSPGNRHLIILAGIAGGIHQILEKIIGQIAGADFFKAGSVVEFLLSPNVNMFEFRLFLQQFPFELIDEDFIEDNSQYYEHLHLRYRFGEAKFNQISAVGDSLWNCITPAKQLYLERLIAHYRACETLGGNDAAKVAVEEYERVLARNKK